MSRVKEPFTLSPRKLKSGKDIYCYQVNLPDGTKLSAESTVKRREAPLEHFVMISRTTNNEPVWIESHISEAGSFET